MIDKEKHTDDINDQLIKDLFNDYRLEEAPSTIKSKAMNRVFNDWTAQSVSYKPIINKNNRWWIIGGFAVLLTLSFVMDASVIGNYWNELNLDETIINIDAMNKQFGTFTSSLKNLPSIVYFTAFGILALLGIDRFFNRLANI